MGRRLDDPLIVIPLMRLAHGTGFDDFDFAVALANVVRIDFLIATASAARVDAAARRARDEIIERLRAERVALGTSPVGNLPTATSEEIDDLIGQLSNLDLGAFRRTWDQPLIRATTSGVTGLGLTCTKHGRILHRCATED